MPLYDYLCANCGHEVEVMHSVHGHGPAACPVCGGQMKKAIVAPAVHFKGSGWARKDRSGSSARSSHASTDSGSDTGSGSGSGSGGEPSSSSAAEQPKAASAETSAKDAD
jgi:putative FmdB family regulatory protein